LNTNKDLWHSVSKTDPRAVKPITGKQYQGNSPKPYWLIERATEEFGPIGIGWGVTVKSERFERLGEFDVLHVAVVSVWYVKDGKRTESFDQMGGTKAAYKTAKGTLMVDEDAGKKSVTDGMVKCLSMIGFAGDIFSGRWDDSKYVEATRQEFEEKHALEDQLRKSIEHAKHAKEQARRDALDEFALQLIEWHEAGKDMEAIKAWYDPKTFAESNEDRTEEQLYVWGLLKPHSALRSAIKKNRPVETEHA
jgi:hypothetical protein